MKCSQATTASCYLCGTSEYTLRDGVVRDNPDLEIRECVQCGLVTLSCFDHIVPGHYENSGMHSGQTPSIESWLRETDVDDERRFGMLKASLTNKRILDFGCGAAGFVMKAQSIADRAVGVEAERRVREYWAGRLSIYENLDSAGTDYDVITAFHVIEHLPDPREALRQMAQHLGDDGRLIIEVPSCDDALLSLFHSGAFQRFTYWSQHLFLFKADTLSRLAEQAGLKVVAVEQYQRYPLSNHLYWLSEGNPGGHKKWSFLDSPELTNAYADALAAVGKCDTVIGYFERH